MGSGVPLLTFSLKKASPNAALSPPNAMRKTKEPTHLHPRRSPRNADVGAIFGRVPVSHHLHLRRRNANRHQLQRRHPRRLPNYDNFGRPVEVKNGASAVVGGVFTIANPLSSTTYAYDPATLVLDTETVSHDINQDGTPELTRVIDRKQDTLLRNKGYAVGALPSGGVDQETTYQYDNTGRLAAVSGGGLNPPSQFQYNYEPNSNLLKTVTGPAHTVTNSYDPTRNVLLNKENKAGTTIVSNYAYDVNAIGQRTDVSQSGSAFATARDIAWGYDPLGQVTKADSTIPGLDRAYQYDLIGNRLKASDSLTLPATPNYTTNSLNQYTAVGANTPAYDLDGNATSYPLPANLSASSTLTWDAENRLTSVTLPDSTTVTYAYDATSRRIAKTTSAGTTLYLYDAWNPIAEYIGSAGVSPTLSKTYLWGMDLSGTMQGAGGVGGLLLITDHSALITSYSPTYDGNGNVSEYLDPTGATAAHYEYDPFGKTTVATGPSAITLTHRFSTKPLDTETGLYYYGYRYYDPATGRWPSRDPIGELGGVNLYGFVGNNGLNRLDYLGLEDTDPYPNRCCDEETISKGEDELIMRFQRIEKNNEDMGVPRGGGDGPNSCYGVNYRALLELDSNPNAKELDESG